MMTKTTELVVTSSNAVTAAHTVTVAPAVYGRLLVMEKPPGRFRHEMKYGLDGTADTILSSRLRKLFRHDRHADSHGSYRVSSLYFDTPYDKAMWEKMAGIRKREKFRIRYYNDDMSFIRLEKKYKVGNLCSKRSASLTFQQVVRLLEGDAEFLLESGDALLTEFYSKIKGQLLRPVTMVSYMREAFLYDPGNVRITIDRQLRSGSWYAGFPADMRKVADVSEGKGVLEVKYDDFLPDIVRMAVQADGLRWQAYSKYAASRRFD
ncbi:MAG: polyphosphate polymerase domain-containing protein [Anaerovoracaceae bacterium]|nr:polyphosphate polymerase domain-containing protein [Anaerovoracaceae bacterium]